MWTGKDKLGTKDIMEVQKKKVYISNEGDKERGMDCRQCFKFHSIPTGIFHSGL